MECTWQLAGMKQIIFQDIRHQSQLTARMKEMLYYSLFQRKATTSWHSQRITFDMDSSALSMCVTPWQIDTTQTELHVTQQISLFLLFGTCTLPKTVPTHTPPPVLLWLSYHSLPPSMRNRMNLSVIRLLPKMCVMLVSDATYF
jgi:hypothetical protein